MHHNIKNTIRNINSYAGALVGNSFDDDIFYRKSLYGNDLVNIRTEFKEREKAKQQISLDYDYNNMELAQRYDINNIKIIRV